MEKDEPARREKRKKEEKEKDNRPCHHNGNVSTRSRDYRRGTKSTNPRCLLTVRSFTRRLIASAPRSTQSHVTLCLFRDLKLQYYCNFSLVSDSTRLDRTSFSYFHIRATIASTMANSQIDEYREIEEANFERERKS